MKRLTALPLLVAALLAAVNARASGQAPEPTGTEDSAFLTRATAVLVDVVVRDRQGRPVMDLKADDFEIFEDNVPQTIGSFALVSRGGGIGIDVRLRDEESTTVVTPTGGTDQGAPPAAPPVMALVFDALSADALNLSQRAALQHIGMSGETHARIAVFSTEPSISVVQPYTSDPTLLRQAVTRLAPAGTETKQASAERMDELRRRRRTLEEGGGAAAAAAATEGEAIGAAGGLAGQLEMQRRMIIGEMRMLRSFETLDRDHRGYSTTHALVAVLESMAYLPGRKSVVFFSEGLPASPALQTQLQKVIESANRSNITVYAVDATGLRVISSTDDTFKEVKATAEERLRQVGQLSEPTDGPLTRMIERTEDLMRYDSQGGLARLADDTGGFLVRDTNNIGSAFTRIDEDMRFHYLLTYSPRNDVLDGNFRTIGVKVKRPGTRIFARKGYRAVRTPVAPSMLTYEAPLLEMLDKAPLPNAFPSQAAAYSFPEADRPGLTPIVVRVTTDALQYQIDPQKGTYNAQAAVVVRVRDSDGGVVQKLSQQYVLSGGAGELDAAKKGEILFYREAELAPGVYQVESIVYDAIANQGSARISTLSVPEPAAPRLRMSSLVLVARSEQTPSQAEDPDTKKPPFYYGDTLLYPNVGEPIHRRPDRRCRSISWSTLSKDDAPARRRFRCCGTGRRSPTPRGPWRRAAGHGCSTWDSCPSGSCRAARTSCASPSPTISTRRRGRRFLRSREAGILPDFDPRHLRGGRGEVSDQDVEVAVAVVVGEVQRRVARRPARERPALEDTRAHLLQPDERRHLRLVEIGTARDERAGDDVEVAVAIEIPCLRAEGPGQVRKRMRHVRIAATVLQPHDPVIGLHDLVVEGVAMRQEHVEVAVLVEVHELNP